VAYALSNEMKIIDLKWLWRSLSTSTVGYSNDSWASCYAPAGHSQWHPCRQSNWSIHPGSGRLRLGGQWAAARSHVAAEAPQQQSADRCSGLGCNTDPVGYIWWHTKKWNKLYSWMERPDSFGNDRCRYLQRTVVMLNIFLLN